MNPGRVRHPSWSYRQGDIHNLSDTIMMMYCLAFLAMLFLDYVNAFVYIKLFLYKCCCDSSPCS